MKRITRYRGDTFPFQFTVRESGEVKDITDHTLLMSVQDEESPAADEDPLFTLTGTLTDPTNGVVTFAPTAEQMDLVGRYWYDVEMTDPDGLITTVVKGPLLLEHDLTASHERTYSFEDLTVGDTWEPAIDGVLSLGWSYGSFHSGNEEAPDPNRHVWVRERDGLIVLSCEDLVLTPNRPSRNTFRSREPGYDKVQASCLDILCHVYLDHAIAQLEHFSTSAYCYHSYLTIADGSNWRWWSRYQWQANGAYDYYDTGSDGSPLAAGWYCARFQHFPVTGQIRGKSWAGAPADEPAAWYLDDTTDQVLPGPLDCALQFYPQAASYVAQLAQLTVRVIP